ncbi:MAG: hypothetical protein IRY89_13400 [Pseudolabrys sp.]|nr:hypothetical protein [Pseudolabrys sp.]
MPHRRRRHVLIETRKGRRKAPFTVPESASAVEVSLRLREIGWTPYKVRFDTQLQAWIALVIDWQRAA